jgi:hypothetical protein
LSCFDGWQRSEQYYVLVIPYLKNFYKNESLYFPKVENAIEEKNNQRSQSHDFTTQYRLKPIEQKKIEKELSKILGVEIKIKDSIFLQTNICNE